MPAKPGVTKLNSISRSLTVTSGSMPSSARLDDAYKTAHGRKDAASSEETQLAELRERYPELADKVVEGELGIATRSRASGWETRKKGPDRSGASSGAIVGV